MCDTTVDRKNFFLAVEKDTGRTMLVHNSLSPVLCKLPPHTSSHLIFEPGKINLKFLFY